MLNKNYLNSIISANVVNSVTPTMKDQQGNILVGRADLNGPKMLSADVKLHKLGDVGLFSQDTGLFFSIGNGTKPESIDDCKLDSDINLTNFNILSGSNMFLGTDFDNTTRFLTQTWNYIGSVDIQITEIGLFHYWYDGTTNPFKNLELLLDRTLLPGEGITIHPNDTFTISLTLGGKATIIAN